MLSARDLEAPDNAPQINIIENQVAENVLIQLGAKGSILTGRIIDAATRKPLTVCTITMRRTDNPENLFITGPTEPGERERGVFKLLIPARPFTIEVTAPGYETWHYSNDGLGKHADALNLEKGETKKLTIALQPIK